jgi:hypothetical protein
MQIQQSKSFKLSLIHWAVIAVSILMFASPLGEKPDAIHSAMVLPFVYCLFSFIPPLIGIILGIRERTMSLPVKNSYLGIGINAAYLFAFFAFVYVMWDGWMGI